MVTKIAQVRELLKDHQLDALFITGQENVSYLTGFTGLSEREREGFLFITLHHSYLLTFPTYFGLYQKCSDEFSTFSITFEKRLTDHLNDIIEKEKLKKIGLEKDHMTIAEYESLKTKLNNTTFEETAGIIEKLRLIKTENEIKAINQAVKIADMAFDFIRTKIKKGVSEKDIALEIEFFIKRNADDIAFSPIVAFNAGAAIPHYLPSHNSQLTTHNLILLDFGAKIGGYCSDMTRVIFFGPPPQTIINIYNTVLEAQRLTLAKIKPGEKCAEMDITARNYIRSKGYPEYPHGLGHGVGLAIHEAPRLKKDSDEILEENMAVTVEPGIYIEGKYGIRIEDLVILTHNGVEVLTKSNKTLEDNIIA